MSSATETAARERTDTTTGADELVRALRLLGVDTVPALPARSVDGFGADFAATLAEAVAEPGPNVVVVRAALTPPPSTSPRWYRRGGGRR